MPVKRVFLDTGFAIALASPRDRYHDRAVHMRQRDIQAALAADIHFQQAGFKALLLQA